MKETLRFSIVLGLICFLASGLLAAVNTITAPKIKQQKEDKERLALNEVMPGARSFKFKSISEEEGYYLAYDENNKLVGFVIKGHKKGYSSDIEVMLGLNLNLKISGIKILSQNETPGLGSRIAEDSFLNQFKNKNSLSLDGVQTITGATISSSAVIKSIEDKALGLKDILFKEISDAK